MLKLHNNNYIKIFSDEWEALNNIYLIHNATTFLNNHKFSPSYVITYPNN